MRLVTRLILMLVAFVALCLISLVVFLPRIVATDQVRSAIEQASNEALGRPLQYGDLSVGILPPRIELSSPRIAGTSATAKPLFSAERIDLRIALLPLLRWIVLIDSLEIDGMEIEVIRTADGFELPIPPPAPAGTDDRTPDAESDGVAMAIRSLRVTNGRVSIMDRSVSPPATIGLEAIEVAVQGVDPALPFEFEGESRLTTGGEVTFRGRSSLDGVLDLSIQLKDLVLAPFGAYAGQDVELDGTASGELVVKGPSAAPDSMTLALALELARGRSGAAVIEGPIAIGAELRGDLARPTGSFSIDATEARLFSSDSFDKPRGVVALCSGKFATDSAGALGVTLEKLALSSMLARGRIDLGDKTVITLDADPFPFEELRKLSPFTEGTEVNGVAAIRGFRVQVEPLSLKGEIVVENARFGLASGGGVEFKGRMVGKGNGVDWVDFDLATGGQHIGLSGKARDLQGRAPFSFQLASVGVVDANALLTGLDPSLGDTLYGPMTISGDVSGVGVPGTKERDIIDLLDGRIAIDIGKTVGNKDKGGRFVGFSALGSVLKGLEEVGEMAQITTILLGGNPPDLSAYTKADFDNLAARLRVHDGVLESDSLRIEYPQYSVDLRGTIAISTLALDMNGELRLGSQLAAALGARSTDGQIVVPVAQVGGTLEEPKIEISKAGIASLSAQLLSNNANVKTTLESAEKIAPGSGRLLEKALEGVMRSGKKKE
jgi:hypothetical protein